MERPTPDAVWVCWVLGEAEAQCTAKRQRDHQGRCGWYVPAPPAGSPAPATETPNAPAWVHAVTPAAIVAQREAGWPDFHPEDFCHRCGRRNPVWWCALDVWSVVFPDHAGIVCPSCFAESYAAVHPRAIFELLATDPAAPSTPTPAERPDPLPYPERPTEWLRVGQLREAIATLNDDAPITVEFPNINPPMLHYTDGSDAGYATGPDGLPARYAFPQASDADGVTGTDPMTESTLGVLVIGCTDSPADGSYPDEAHPTPPPSPGATT